MKFWHTISTVFWLLLLVIACNTTPTNNTTDKDEAADKNERVEDAAQDKDNVNTDISAEPFPEGAGFKGRYNDYVFYIEVSDTDVKGFVRHKNDDSENEVFGKMASPFDFNAEELTEDEDGEELTLAKLRGKKGDDDNSFELDYSDANGPSTFKVTLKR